MKSHRSSLLSRAIRKSRESPCRHKVVAIGINHRGVPISIRTNRKRFYTRSGGWHAEELVIYNSPKSLRRVLIARINASGKLLPIHPCEKCKRIAARFGITIEPLEQ